MAVSGMYKCKSFLGRKVSGLHAKKGLLGNTSWDSFYHAQPSRHPQNCDPEMPHMTGYHQTLTFDTSFADMQNARVMGLWKFLHSFWRRSRRQGNVTDSKSLPEATERVM